MSFSSLRNKITSTHTRGGQGRNIKKSKARQSLYNFCTTIAHVELWQSFFQLYLCELAILLSLEKNDC